MTYNDRNKKTGLFFVGILFGLMSLSIEARGSFMHTQIGDEVPNRQLILLSGKSQHLLGNARANVFIFFRPTNHHSALALKQIQQIKQQMQGKSIYWSAVVSNFYSETQIQEMVRDTGLDIPVLIDPGDQLYGEIGVKLHPTVGIADNNHRLVAYLPFLKINYGVVIEAHIRLLLGEINKQQFEKILNPKEPVSSGNRVSAKRNWHMAEMFYKMGKWETAKTAVDRSVKSDPKYAPAYALRAMILAKQGLCDKAKSDLAQANRLGNTDVKSKSVVENCKP